MSNWYVDYMEGEVPFEDIEKRESEFLKWAFEPVFELQANGYESVLDEIKKYTVHKYEKATKEEQEKMVEDVLAIYRSINILPIQYFSETGVMNEIEKCINYKAEFDGNTISCGAGIGTSLCNYLFPNLFDVPSQHDLDKKGAESLYRKFFNDVYLKRAIKFCFSYKDGCPLPTCVMGGLRLVGSAPTNFRPMNAKAVYERFAPEGGTIYDFCCVDDETEFFSGTEWKLLSSYTEGDRVLQYNEDGSANLVEPEQYIHYKSDDPFYEYTGKMFNSCLTGNHDVVYRKRINDTSELTSECFKIKQSEIIDKDFRGLIPMSFKLDGDVSVDENLLRLLVAVQADATIDDFKTGRVRACFTKWHKVERYKYLLDTLGISYRCSPAYIGEKDGEYIYFNDLGVTSVFKSNLKEFPLEWYNLSLESKVVLLDEIVNWDGSINYGVKTNKGIKSRTRSYSTTSKHNADLVFFLANSDGGFGASMHIDDSRGNPNYSTCYGITFREKSGHSSYRGHKNKYITVNKEDKYCFVVPSHMLVLRRRGQIFVTGNCGFGGRMLGCLSSKKNFKYVGTDPCTETMYNLHKLADYIEMVTDREDSYELHCCGSEVFRGKPDSIDFAFSSPPYFDLEVYSSEDTQCFNKFPVLEDWLEGYVRETIKNIYYMLKSGCYYAVNIADFTVSGGKTVAYVDEWVRISTEEGMPLFDTVYLGVTARAGSKQQASGELKKENILIFKK